MASLLVTFLLVSLHFVSSTETRQQQEQQAVLSLLKRHEAQLNRIETLIESLSKSVSSLESSLKSSSPSLNPTRFAVTKPKTLFAEKFLFSGGARLESDPSCAAALPYAEADGTSRYFVVGDPLGRVFVLSAAAARVVLEIPAVLDSPVTSILAYFSPPGKNDTLLFTGHGDGSIAAYRISELDGGCLLKLDLVSSRLFARGSRDQDSPPVVNLEVHQVGRTRYIVAADGGGRLRVFSENAGTLYGTAIASSRPLAFVKQRLFFLTKTGTGALDLRSMTVKESLCEGLNGSFAKSYTFDGSERSKAYGFTSEGDLIHIILLGDAGNIKCKVRSIRKSEIDGEPVSVQIIRGYLLAVTQEKVYVYNVSSQYYGRVGAPRPLFSFSLQEIKSIFLNSNDALSELSMSNHIVATDQEKLIMLGLGGGHLAIYRSTFPVFKSGSNSVFLTVPVLLFLLFLIGISQFYVKKKDSLVWAPEESFSAPSASSGGSHLVPRPGERAFGDVPRVGNLRDLRGGLRGARRRYLSPPSRYPGGPTIPFRPSSSDPTFRATTDLVFRRQILETPPGFPSRRQALFPNTQAVDEHID